MEEDLGLSLPQGSNSHHALDAAEHVARIAFALSQEALAFETEKQQAQPATHPTFSRILPYPASSGMNYHDQHLEEATGMAGQQAAALDEQLLLSGVALPEDDPGILPSVLLSSSALPVGGASHSVVSEPPRDLGDLLPFRWIHQASSPQRSIASHEFVAVPESVAHVQPLVASTHSVGLAPQAPPLLPHDSEWRNSWTKCLIEPLQGTYSEFDPGSWLDDVPMIDSSPDGERQSQAFSPQWLPPDQAVPAKRSACQVPGEEKRRAAGQSASAVLAGGAGAVPTVAAAADTTVNFSAVVAAAFATGDSYAASTETDATAKPSAAVTVAPATDEADAAATTVALGPCEASVAAPPPATEAALEPYWIRTHPYVRLPVLQEEVVPPHNQLTAWNFVSRNASSVEATLLCIRRLFMKQALDQSDIASLVGDLQELAVASAFQSREHEGMPGPVQGVATIGLQFLVLDYTVSALHVLGVSPPSCIWWERFTECFDTGYRYTEPRRRTQYSRRVNINLGNRMLAAMSTYKTGKRPNLEEIIHLKRILFFSSYSPSDFRSPTWDPWRADHLNFQRENPEFSECLRDARSLQY
ncbi:hypothetical protein EPH_0041470 [Eimeria praecox]|uniref:Uncharacterized protein n=1 Tax=Eimeria praecox TaxID=51316 RepID=U6G5H9_9EIME|nr:hypothetical protein EPH_0041470 [Eimeria praecox]